MNRKIATIVIALILWPLNTPAGGATVQNAGQVIALSHESDSETKVKARNLQAWGEMGSSIDLTFSAWGSEGELKIRLAADSLISEARPVSAVRNGAPSWQLQAGALMHAVYKKENGNLEWEIVLAGRPAANRLEFLLESAGVEFFYQDTVCELPGCDRPDQVKGSYAVYLKNGRDDSFRVIGRDTIGIKYQGGKAFHIYRPKAWDASDDTVWCDIFIDEKVNRLTLTLPDRFLDRALYPVIVDPTFGYTSNPATRVELSSSYAVLVNTRVASSGDTITSYSAFCADLSNNDATGAVIAYSISGGLPSARIASPAALPAISGSVGQWYQTAAVTHGMTGGTEYCVAIGNYANGLCGYYDSGTGTNYSRSTTGLADPWSSVGTGSQRFGVYATYVTGSSAQASRRRSATVRVTP